MGAWGYTIFEDDMGADWALTFCKHPSTKTVESMLTNTRKGKFLGEDESVAALCCLEIVAAARGNPVNTIPEELCSWAQSTTESLASAGDFAHEIVDAVQDNSDLADTWAGIPEWIAYLKDLKGRLSKSDK